MKNIINLNILLMKVTASNKRFVRISFNWFYIKVLYKELFNWYFIACKIIFFWIIKIIIESKKCTQMKLILFLLFFYLQVHIASGVFCFPVCGSCNSPSYDKCTGTCQAATSFSKLGSLTPFTCVKTTYNYYGTGSKW